MHPVSKLFLVLACAALARSLAVHAFTYFGLFWAYAIFNFLFAAIILHEGGSPGVVVGERVLFTHGAVESTLAEGKYARHLVYEARAQSGHRTALFVTCVVLLREQTRSRMSWIRR